MRQSHRRPARNAATEYGALRAEIAELITKLHAKLAEHAAAQAKEATRWGYVGDLEHIASLLRCAVGEESREYL